MTWRPCDVARSRAPIRTAAFCGFQTDTVRPVGLPAQPLKKLHQVPRFKETHTAICTATPEHPHRLHGSTRIISMQDRRPSFYFEAACHVQMPCNKDAPTKRLLQQDGFVHMSSPKLCFLGLPIPDAAEGACLLLQTLMQTLTRPLRFPMLEIQDAVLPNGLARERRRLREGCSPRTRSEGESLMRLRIHLAAGTRGEMRLWIGMLNATAVEGKALLPQALNFFVKLPPRLLHRNYTRFFSFHHAVRSSNYRSLLLHCSYFSRPRVCRLSILWYRLSQWWLLFPK